MTDFTANLTPVRKEHAHSAEYGIYFGLIFIVSLPGAAIRCLAAAVRGDFAGPGLLRRASRRAGEITPQIFGA